MHILYIANKNYSSWSLRPWLLMTQFGIPFEERIVPLGLQPGTSDYSGVSPSGKVPCLVDQQLTVWDSLAITEYLAEIHPKLWPGSLEARAWARSAAAEMHSGFNALREQCNMNCGVRVKLENITPHLQKDLDRLDSLWRDGLQRFGGPFLAGKDFSAVDAFFAPVAFRIQTYQLPLSENALGYAARLLALDGMQAWYNAALVEPWRIDHFDRVTLNAGPLIADYRNTDR